MWEVINQTQEHSQMFNMAMAGFESNVPPLPNYSMAWAAEKANEDPERILVVDVGGGNGQALKGICKATPGVPASRCALEDLPQVVELAKQRNDPELEGVTWVGMDFHQEQPIKGELLPSGAGPLLAAEARLTVKPRRLGVLHPTLSTRLRRQGLHRYSPADLGRHGGGQ